ncbi:DUF6286 domain-containing protein [Klenkia sp. PcliD-1-E]|uniref:DUF6286 domain-containing protein n=1 Tax=Klenkia sp. PcliD-1-E TaxID=2954492 RepID=UPI0020979D59|nr:DUF6286 domain-containing protein [Klenkia sp. PcliD-1-E]MCO7218359.1 DUF6286 domain-containing protein [Klenkia sp. PcliD-1-E]
MRLFDRIAAVVLAALGFAAGAVVVVEIAHRAFGGTGHLVVPYEPAAGFVRGHAWSSAPVIVIGVGLAVVGLVVLIAELTPRRPGLLVLESGHPDVTAALPRSSVARVVEHAAGDVPGVESVRAAARGRRVTLTARTLITDPGDLSTQLDSVATQALAGLHLRRTPPVTVRIQGGPS